MAVCLLACNFAFADFSKRSLRYSRWEFRKWFLHQMKGNGHKMLSKICGCHWEWFRWISESEAKIANKTAIGCQTWCNKREVSGCETISYEQRCKTEWMRMWTESGPPRERLPSWQRQCSAAACSGQWISCCAHLCPPIVAAVWSCCMTH